MRNVLYFMYFFLMQCSIKAEESTLENTTIGVNKSLATTRIKEYTGQPRSLSSDSSITKPETPTQLFISEDYTFEFEGCFDILTYPESLLKDGFSLKLLTHSTQLGCFEWCIHNSRRRMRYFSIWNEFCGCSKLTFPDDFKTNMSNCGGEACERFGKCKGTSSYVGVYEILDVKTIHGNNGEEDEKDGSVTLSRDLLIAIATAVCCLIAALIGFIMCPIKRITHLRKKLLGNLGASAEMPTDFEVRSYGITSQRRGTATSLVEINNDIYNSQDIISPLPNPHPMRNYETAVKIEQADDVSSDAASSDDYQDTGFPREPLCHRDASTPMPPGFESVDLSKSSEHRGSVRSMADTNKEVNHYQEIGLLPPTPHRMRNVGSAVGMEQTDDVNSDTADNDYQSID